MREDKRKGPLRSKAYDTGMESFQRAGLILGIESSCDETAAALVQQGSHILSNVVASQIAVHAAYGGVVPELASREHLRNIVPVARAAMRQADVSLNELDAIAVTEGPGLAGALLVGILYAKALAFGLGKPLIAVNHLEGHIHAVLMDARARGSEFHDFPLLALVVSGGHTHLYLAEEKKGAWTYRNVGRTVDDAAGEAYDKVAKLLGLGYPGGPWMDALAAFGDPTSVPFNFGPIRSKQDGLRFDFSFSGIKTAVLRFVERNALQPAIEARRKAIAEAAGIGPAAAANFCDAQTLGLISSFQSAVVGVLLRQTFAAAEAFGAHAILVSGGVAANRELRCRFEAEAASRGLSVAFPAIALSTDNAAMVAAAAWPKLQAGHFAPESMSAEPQLRLGA
jgi:N6-L-threonylcarbamoyladenine synthase